MGKHTFLLDGANEQSLIAAALCNPEDSYELIRNVDPGLFADPSNRRIWEVAHRLCNEGEWYSPEVARRHLLDDDKAIKRLATLETIEVDWHPPDITRRLNHLRWDAQRGRAYTEIVPELLAALCKPTSSPENVQGLTSKLQSVLAHHVEAVKSTDSVQKSYAAHLHELKAAGGRCYGLGLSGFDEILGTGFAPGHMTLLAAETGVGKTAVACNWALALAKEGRRPAYCVWEGEINEILNRMCSIETGIDFGRIATGALSDDEIRTVVAACREISEKVRFVDNPFRELRMADRAKMSQALGILDGLLSSLHCDVVIYDMFERVVVDDSHRAFVQAAEGVEELHKHYGVHGIALGQVNIDKVGRGGSPRIRLADIKGFKKLVEICQQVFVIEAPSMWGGSELDPRTKLPYLETTKLKDRNGKNKPKGGISVRWTWDGNVQTISDPRRVVEDEGFGGGDDWSEADFG